MCRRGYWAGHQPRIISRQSSRRSKTRTKLRRCGNEPGPTPKSARGSVGRRRVWQWTCPEWPRGEKKSFSASKSARSTKPVRAAECLQFSLPCLGLAARLWTSRQEAPDHSARLTADLALKIRQGFLAASFGALRFVEEDRQRPKQ